VHRKGALTVEGCLLRTDAHGLGHLISPLVTRATGPGSLGQQQQQHFPQARQVPHGERIGGASLETCGDQISVAAAAAGPKGNVRGIGAAAGIAQSSQGSAHELMQKHMQQVLVAPTAAAGRAITDKCTHAGATTAATKGQTPARWPAAAATSAPVGPGRLSVLESRLLGGCTAVRCEGTGQVRSVRVIYEAHATLFYLEVDSSEPQGWQGVPPALKRHGQQEQQQKWPSQAQPFKETLEVSKVSLPGHLGGVLPEGPLVAPGCHLDSRCGFQGLGPPAAPVGGAAEGLQKIQNLLGNINPGMLEEHLRDRRDA
jgi:hypothetical protein